MSKASSEHTPEIVPVQPALAASGAASASPMTNAPGKTAGGPNLTDASFANPRVTPGRMPLFRR
jgi:hypothetical protein